MSKNFEKSFSTKLYHPATLEDETNHETFAVIRQLEDKLKIVPDFVSIVPYGSSMRGYSNKDSDIDIYILYDTPLDSSSVAAETIKKVADQFKTDAGVQGSKDVNFGKNGIVNINTDHLISYLNSGDILPIIPALQALCMRGTGNRIASYRGVIADALNKLPDEQRLSYIQDIVDALVIKDDLAFKKIGPRTGITDAEFDILIKERRKLWTQRVQRLLQGD